MSGSTKWASKSKVCFYNAITVSLFLLQLSFACNPAFYFNMRKKLWRNISSSSRFYRKYSIIRFSGLHRLLASSSNVMTDSQYLGAIQIRKNLNEHHHHSTSTKSMISQIGANCSPFQSLPFHIRLEGLKLIYYNLISIFSKYHFKTDTLCLLVLSSHVFTSLEFDNNYFSIVLWKIVKPWSWWNYTTYQKNISKR